MHNEILVSWAKKTIKAPFHKEKKMSKKCDDRPLICERCGAPYNGIKCEYCGTKYSLLDGCYRGPDDYALAKSIRSFAVYDILGQKIFEFNEHDETTVS